MRKVVLLLSLLAVDAWAAPPMGDAPAKLMSVTPVEEPTATLELNKLEEELKRLTAEQGFFVLEEALNAELAYAVSIDNKALVQSKIKKIAAFYIAHDLHVEGLAALKKLDDLDREARLLAAKGHYAMGRYEAVHSLYANAEAPVWLIAQVKTRLGAYDEAQRLFSASNDKDRSAEYFLMKAEAASSVGEKKEAKAALDAAAQIGLSPTQQAARNYLMASLSSSPEKPLRTIVQSAQEPWASKAALLLLKRAVFDQSMSIDQAIYDFEPLRLRSDNASFRRDLAMARVDVLKSKGDVVGQIASLRYVVDDHAQSDQAAEAELKIRSVLASLFESEKGLTAIESAQLFYENIAYAPPGEQGDALIRNVADRLVNLDLADSAAELLEHQVFNRLRGFERSLVAAKLADIYLASDEPEEALRVLRSTRIAGLEKAVNDRRRLLEVKALDAAGKTESALSLLDTADSKDEKRLKADIYWRMEAWNEAGAAYRDILKISPDAPEAFMRAAVAFSMSDNSKALIDLLAKNQKEWNGSAEFALAQTLLIDEEKGQSVQSVSAFMQAYREKYQPAQIGG